MSSYLVTFQAKELQTREKIREFLKTFDSYCAVHNTCWVISTDLKAKQIRDKVGEIIQPGDRLLVLRSGTEGAWRNVLGGAASSEWLKENL